MRKTLFVVLALLAIAATGFALMLFKIDTGPAIVVAVVVVACVTLAAFGSKTGRRLDFRKMWEDQPLLATMFFGTTIAVVAFYTHSLSTAMTSAFALGLIITLAIIVKDSAASGRVALVPIDGIGHIDADGRKHYTLAFG
ncbi:MAG: hypothetical protein UX29_C0011G0018 [Parcubacteria group bacterium GW2011_GWA2_46_10]|nr:MAG: hypothetical protein UX29_C0011G0018 [Parcubacteria group bacterium GW2011_GWA2_46_10]